MNEQSIFNKVYRHLLKQNKKSRARIGGTGKISCAYRGDNGLRCAVGCLIPNKAYSPKMEGLSVECISGGDYRSFPSLDWMHKHRFLLSDLQKVHDRVKPSAWPTKLKELANEYKLKIPKVKP